MNRACPDCTQALAGPWHGFHASCASCKARTISRSPQYAESQRAGRITESYRAVLQKALDVDVGAAHALAKAWAEREARR